jgi:murein DD-endopeptidase MepM/ murein hydrolase activator NlpD
MAAGVAGCSADIARFSDTPFSSASTLRPGQSDVTGSVPRGRVDTQALPAPSGVSGGGGGIGSYQPPAGPPAARMASAPARPAGTAPQATPAVAPVAMHSVTPGETLTSIARHYGKSRAEIAKANHIDAYAIVRVGQKLVIPGVHPAPAKTAANVPARAPAPAPLGAPPAKLQPPAPAATQVAAAQPAASARLVTPANEPPQETGSATRDLTGAVPGFRWPVRGRVIAGYGAKVNGAANDGINLSVPEGTSVKAAEDGVVAYAGNELKGYGNLVLVRHANGFVTAYAHASEIMVKRGDQVKRGQVLARAGQTGNVTSPQLHFEIRKGSTPVDPTEYLTN